MKTTDRRLLTTIALSTAVAVAILAVPSARADSGKEGNPPCISWVQRAPYRNAGYDHEVEITNGCDRGATCVVRTDVNPDPITAGVDAGATVTVLTFRGSPAYAFTAQVACRLNP